MEKDSAVTILVGAQWGDEGKGKWIDILAQQMDVVVRYQGGNNAGHTLYIEGEKIVLHQIPSGIFHPSQACGISAGVVVNPPELVKELQKVTARSAPVGPDRFWISARSHVITPWHIHLDGLREKGSKNPIGTTKRGIGPTYADKAYRVGLRMGHFIDSSKRSEWLTRMIEGDGEFKRYYECHPETLASPDEAETRRKLWKDFFAASEPLAPYVCDAESKIRKSIRSGKKVLVEGAQGTLLDIDHGTYPYVTASNTGTGGAVASIGIAPRSVGLVIGVAKGYVTRVGEGPFPTELKDDTGRFIAQKGQEFGATTGRPRRVGWLDAVALRYVVEASGLDHVILNKLDVLTGLTELKIAVAYQHPTLGRLEELPWDTGALAQCVPIYESFPGWSDPLPHGGHFEDLPPQTRAYIRAVERLVGTKVSMVGTGPQRDHAVFCT